MISLIAKSNKRVQMNLFTKHKQTHRLQKQTGLPKWIWKGGINQEFGIYKHTLLYVKQSIKMYHIAQGTLFSTL